MSLLSLRRRHHKPTPVPVERPDVRRYRQLLSVAPPDVLERLHVTALGVVDPLVRAMVLRTAQDRLLSGRGLTVDDVRQIAHLVSTGETRTPGIIVSALDEMALGRLAHAIVRDPVAVDLLDPADPGAGSEALELSAETLTNRVPAVRT